MTVQTHTLSNGFRIVTENMPGLGSASLGIWVAAGGRHETAEQNGMAHFLEHMAFKGTKRRNALQIAEAIEDVGGYINAYTSREMTAYYARVLKDDVPLALDVIGDILVNPAFDPREIEVERGVILQEIGQSLDTPDDVVFDWLQEEAFRAQPMGRTILGPAERVRSFQTEDFRRFVAQHYGPQNLILSAAGAVDHDEIVRLADSAFSHLGAAPAASLAPATFTRGERREIKALEQAHFTLALPAPANTDAQMFAAQVYASVMGGGMSSRLFQEIREKRGLCYTIFAQSQSFSDAGMLMLYAGTGGEDVAGLAEVTADEMRRAAETISDVEVTRAKTQMKAGMVMGLESPSSRAERMARTLAIWGRVPSLEETVAKVDAVDVAAVRAYGASLLEGPAAMALYGPVEQALDLDDLQGRLAA
ncbi:MAG: pitrilysin family protein [Pseudomonadota bacterium]